MVQMRRSWVLLVLALMFILSCVSVVSGAVKVGDSSMSWNLDVVDLQEVMISYNYTVNEDGSSTFMYVPFSTDSKVTDDVSFRWKFEVYYVGDGREILDPRNEKVLVESGRTKSDLGKLYSFTIPSGVTRFGIKVGVNSTLIDASASAEGTRWNTEHSICRTSNGTLAIAYEGGLNDLWFGKSADEGLTWEIQEISAGTYGEVGILCRADDVIEVYAINSGDVDGFNTSDFGATWSSRYTILDGFIQIEYVSAEVDSNNVRHFYGAVGSSIPYYGNSTSYDTEVAFGDVATRSGALAVDSNNTPYVVYINTSPAPDELYMASPRFAGGWNDSVFITTNVRYLNGYHPSIISGNCSGTDTFYVAATDANDDLKVCNATVNNMREWDCVIVDTLDSFNPSIALTNECRVEVVYSGHATGNSNIYRANMSLGGKWDNRTKIDNVGSVNYPNLADGYFPKWNRINSTGGKSYVIHTRTATTDIYFDNYTIVPFSSTPNTSSPSFFNLSVSPSNNSGYVNGAGYNFSSAWIDNTGVFSVVLWVNGSNYTAVNSGSNTWNFTLYDLAAGDYSYLWNGSDVNGNWNVTGNFTYSISKANGSGSVVSSSGFSVTYGEGTSLSVSESNLGDSDVTYQLHRDGVSISEGLFNESVGTYTILLNMTSGQNYTENNSLDVKQLNVTQATPTVYTSLNGSRANITILLNEVVVLNSSLINGQGDIRLYKNGTLINNGSSPLINTTLFNGTGVYNITTEFPSNQNWTGDSETWYVIVNEPAADTSTPSYSNLVVSPSNNSVYVYGQFYQFNSTWADDTSVDTVLFSFDGVNYSTGVSGSVYFYNFTHLAVGSYSYYFWANDTSGNVNTTGELVYTVQQASSSCNLNSNSPVTYPGNVQVNLSCTNPESIENLYRDGVNISSENGTLVSLTAGTYAYVGNVSASQNYSGASSSINVTVNKGSLSLYLNFDPSNSITNGTQSNVSGSGCVAGVSCKLFRDGVNVSNPEVATLNVGSYGYVYNTSGNENYSAATTSGMLTVSLPTVNAFKIRDSVSVDVIKLESDGDVTANGDVNSSRLCLTNDCISAWSEVNISSPPQNPFDQSLNTTDNVKFNTINATSMNLSSTLLFTGTDSRLEIGENLFLGLYGLATIKCESAQQLGGFFNGTCFFDNQIKLMQKSATDDFVIDFVDSSLTSLGSMSLDTSASKLTITAPQVQIISSPVFIANSSFQRMGPFYFNQQEATARVLSSLNVSGDLNVAGSFVLTDLETETICASCNATDTSDINLGVTLRANSIDLKPKTTGSQSGVIQFQFRDRQNNIISRFGKTAINSHNIAWYYYNSSDNFGLVMTQTGFLFANQTSSDTELADEKVQFKSPVRIDGNATVEGQFKAQQLCLSGSCISDWSSVNITSTQVWNTSNGLVYLSSTQDRVGIGTDSPQVPLDVAYDSGLGYDGYFYLRDPSVNTGVSGWVGTDNESVVYGIAPYTEAQGGVWVTPRGNGTDPVYTVEAVVGNALHPGTTAIQLTAGSSISGDLNDDDIIVSMGNNYAKDLVVLGNGDVNVSNGNMNLQQNFTMRSANGTVFSCEISNLGVISCV